MNSEIFIVREIPLDYRFEGIIPQWDEWLSQYPPPEAPYQSSSFFRFLITFSNSCDTPHLFGIWNETDQLIGIAPFRLTHLTMGYSVSKGPRKRITAAYLLGSSAILKPGIRIDNKKLISDLFHELGSVDAIVIQSAQSGQWKELVRNWRATDSLLFPYIRHDWRDCHFIELPATFDEYEKQYNKKKRYNLNRQIRLLREFSGDQLELRICQTADDIDELIQAANETEKFGMKVTLPDKKKLIFLANNGLFLGYILRSKLDTFSVLTGLKNSGSFNVQYFGTSERFSRFSPGASIIHMAIQHMINHLQIKKIDMGYGTPSHSQNSSNSIEERGYLVLARNSPKMRFLTFSENAINHLKIGVKKAVKSIGNFRNLAYRSFNRTGQ